MTMMMGKSVIDEDHPQFIGLYEGNRSRSYVRERVEKADCILHLGAFMTDFNTGGGFLPMSTLSRWSLLTSYCLSGFSANLSPKKTISASHDKVNIRYHTFDKIALGTFMSKLGERVVKRDSSALDIRSATRGCVHKPSRYDESNATPKHTMKKVRALTRHPDPGRSPPDVCVCPSRAKSSGCIASSIE